MKFKRRPRKFKYNRYTFQAIILTFVAVFAYKVSTMGNLSNLFKGGLFQKVQEVTSDLEVHFLDVGQGDCILLMCEGDSMLIDAGDNSEGEKVVDYIEYQHIDKLNYVISTHPDADHIGGMDDVLENVDCGEMIMTNDEKDTKTYQEVVDIIKDKDIKVHVPEANETFELGCSTVTVLGPVTENDDPNNNSIVIRVTHGKESFLFAGDAETEEMEQICDNNADIDSNVYKVSHHGSSTGADKRFLDAVSPEFAVISCAEHNKYGHPHAEVLLYLRENNIAAFRTDEQGTIVAVSDGEGITWNCSPSDSWQSGDR